MISSLTKSYEFYSLTWVIILWLYWSSSKWQSSLLFKFFKRRLQSLFRCVSMLSGSPKNIPELIIFIALSILELNARGDHSAARELGSKRRGVRKQCDAKMDFL
jgi:hypothetical protein